MNSLFNVLLLFILLSIELFATSSNPKVYESLGDQIYNNLPKIENLKNIKQYQSFEKRIQRYSVAVNKTKELGFDVASGTKENEKLEYLKQLRQHQKTNDYFVRSVQDIFTYALDHQDTALFIDIVNNGLLDPYNNSNKILSYYKAHSSEINSEGIIQELLDAEALKNKKRYKPKTKEQLQVEKVKRIRENDKLDKQELEEKLAQELQLKKEKIIQEQERELFH